MNPERRQKWIKKIKMWIRLILNWRFLVCFFVAWMITNGWSYLMFGIGMYLEHPILIAISSAYLAFLWLPVSPEKVVTVAIGLFLVRFLFPKHNEKIKQQLEEASEGKKEKPRKGRKKHAETTEESENDREE